MAAIYPGANAPVWTRAQSGAQGIYPVASIGSVSAAPAPKPAVPKNAVLINGWPLLVNGRYLLGNQS